MRRLRGCYLTRDQQKRVADWLDDRRIPLNATVLIAGRCALYPRYIVEGRLADWWVRRFGTLPRIAVARLRPSRLEG